MTDAAHGAGGDVVLLVPPGALASASLQRAYALARTLRARLHVLCVLPRPVAWERARSPRWPSVLQYTRSVESQLRLWVQSVIVSTGGGGPSCVAVRVRMGDVLDGAVRSLRRLSLRAVFVAPSSEMTPLQVQRLAHRLDAPVLLGVASGRQERVMTAEPFSSSGIGGARGRRTVDPRRG